MWIFLPKMGNFLWKVCSDILCKSDNGYVFLTKRTPHATNIIPWAIQIAPEFEFEGNLFRLKDETD